MSERISYQIKELKELKTLVNDANVLLQNTGVITSQVEERLNTKFAELNVMNPKESLLLYHLEKKAVSSDLTAEEENTLSLLKETANKYKEAFKQHCALATLREEYLAKGLGLKLKSQQKKDFRGNLMNMNLIPPLWFFQKLEDNIPVSIVAAQWQEFNLDVTNERALKIGFISVSYNNIIGKYELHNWVTIHTIEDTHVVKVNSKLDEEDDLL